MLVLNTGSAIDPEAAAMLGALHSRSIGGIKAHLKVLAEKGAANFMSKFYVGYGHKSIGDMASITIFIEAVSMLVAKAIQDSQLYNGQEASTRYIDFAEQPFIDPLNSAESKSILENWRAFYLHGLSVMPEYLKSKYPRNEDENEAVYNKAIKARAFDVMRAFLPAGASTNVAWHGPVRVIGDRLPILRNHPLEEVRNTAGALETAAIKAHPNSFTGKKYDSQEKYLADIATSVTYFDPVAVNEFSVTRDTINRDTLKLYARALSTRPEWTELPRQLDEAGSMQFDYLLDFGSFRDIQRHRAVAQRMPLLSTKHGFEQWYLDEMPESLREQSKIFLQKQEAEIAKLNAAPEVAQYFTAMGYRVPCRLSGTLPALTYLVERRARNDVHPTLSMLAHKMADALRYRLGESGLVLHTEDSPTRFDIKRGKQDITMK